ncbi:TPA: hypothetical protein ACXYK5_002295 [Legionella pneumophila]
MKKNILSLALLVMMSNVNAEMIAPGVEMVSHKTWTTGNASGHVEDSKNLFFLQQVLEHRWVLFMGKFIKTYK